MFRTEIRLSPSEDKITYHTPVLSAGSCFASVMGQKMKENKLQVYSNPFGVIFNPVSLFNLISDSINNKVPDDRFYINNHGVYYNLNLHSDFASEDLSLLKRQVKDTFRKAGDFIRSTRWIIITLGTAWVYEQQNGLLVANCHKLPSNRFIKRLIATEEILSAFGQMYQLIQNLNKNIKFIITISPVRHIKDSLELNSVSKSVLRLASHQICTSYKNVEYFPGYELMMDDLRDYRFYKRDMIHPTEVAEDYIWEKFSNRYFSEETISIISEWQQLKKSLSHKPFNPTSGAHQEFLRKTLLKLEKLNTQIDVQEEILDIKKQIL